MRLVSGVYANEGHVEICIFGFWRPVCDYPFNNNEANVICKSLGYPNVQGTAMHIHTLKDISIITYYNYPIDMQPACMVFDKIMQLSIDSSTDKCVKSAI